MITDKQNDETIETDEEVLAQATEELACVPARIGRHF